MLEAALRAEGTGIAFSEFVGRRGSFEVVLDGALIFSKLAKGHFPNYPELAKLIVANLRK